MVETTKNDRPDILSPAFYKAHEIRRLKSDYGDIESYFPFKDKSYCHEIFKKAKRLVNLIQTNSNPNYESVEDNLLDLINYASYYWEFLQKEGSNGATDIRKYGYKNFKQDIEPKSDS